MELDPQTSNITPPGGPCHWRVVPALWKRGSWFMTPPLTPSMMTPLRAVSLVQPPNVIVWETISVPAGSRILQPPSTR